MSFAISINTNGQQYDGITEVTADQFSYTRLAQNYFEARNDSNGPVGIIDPMAILQKIEDDLGTIFDRAAVDAGSPVKITDLIMERAITAPGTNSQANPFFRTVAPFVPTANIQPWLLFPVPSGNPTGIAGVVHYGGSGQVSGSGQPFPNDAGCVVLPTGFRLAIFPGEEEPPTDQSVVLWLVPFKSPQVFAKLCCCSTEGTGQQLDDPPE